MLFQLSFFSQVELLRTSPDILPALVVALGLLGGSIAGAVAGFAVGLLVDCLMVAAARRDLAGPARASATCAGIYRERFDVTSSLIPPLLCMGLTLFADARVRAPCS